MKGATQALGSMNKTMNLPSLQRIAMEFERENDIMEQRQEMMDDAIDDAMDVGLEEEGDEIVDQVLAEIGVDLTEAVSRAAIPSEAVMQDLANDGNATDDRCPDRLAVHGHAGEEDGGGGWRWWWRQSRRWGS